MVHRMRSIMKLFSILRYRPLASSSDRLPTGSDPCSKDDVIRGTFEEGSYKVLITVGLKKRQVR